MCLVAVVDSAKTFRKLYPKKDIVTVWKFVAKDNGKFVSPVQGTPIKAGWYKADNWQQKIWPTQNSYYPSQRKYTQGIHGFLTRQAARDDSYGCKLIKCWAYTRDMVAVSGNEAVFRKIWIPKEELQ